MNTIQRNFFRLLRCGVFNTTETLEPMSVHKWDKLLQLSILHDVQPYAYKGLEKCKDQFFVNLNKTQWMQWAQLTENKSSDDEEELLKPYKLTNPILNRQLQNILDDELSDLNTRKMLIQIIRIARHILNEGLPLKLLIDLGQMIKEKESNVDYTTLSDWLKKLRFQQMAQLEGALLIELFGFEAADIPFQLALDLLDSHAVHQLGDCFQVAVAAAGKADI